MAKWKKVKLGDVCSIQQSTTELPEKVWLLNLDAIERGSRDVSFFYEIDKKDIPSSTIQFDDEMVLYSKLRPYLNKVILPMKAGVATSEILPLRPKKDLIIRTYLAEFLRSPSFVKHISTKVSGAKMPRVIISEFLCSEIPLPAMEEQKKIAARLDAVSDLLAKQKQLLAEQDTLIQSLFYDMFGIPFKNDKNFKMVSIGDIVSDIQYGTSKKADTSGSTPILRMNNIKYSGEMDYSDLKFIDLEEETNKYLLKKGDILFNRTNSKELVGKTGMYNLDVPMVYAGYLIRVRLQNNFLPICFSVYMNTPYLKEFFLRKCKSIVGMANINAKELQKIPIYLPPLELQEKFAAIVEQIESEKSKIKSAIAETQTLFNALMAEYFEE